MGLKGHNGEDYACNTGTGVYACADGIVTYAIGNYAENDKTGYGNLVSLLIPTDEINTYYDVVYGHLLSTTVKAGDEVKAGQLIGLTNNTGFSTGPHLHFGLRKVEKRAALSGETSRTYLNAVYTLLDYNNGYLGYIDPRPLFDAKTIEPKYPVDFRYGQEYSFLREQKWALFNEAYAKKKCEQYAIPYDNRIKIAFVYGFWDAFTDITKNQYGVFDPAMYYRILHMTKPEFLKKVGTPQGWGAKISPI
jgi:murein DD-endopeptidase MepM/ murein hydrolase activator NlpD